MTALARLSTPSHALALVLSTITLAWPVRAETENPPNAGPVARHGDHPAVVVQRLQAQAGYDHASKFYPHPAWLYLVAEPPSQPAQDEDAPPADADEAP